MNSSLNYNNARCSLAELNMMADMCQYENYTGKILFPLLVNYFRPSTKNRHFPNFSGAQVGSFQPSVGLTITKIIILHDKSALATLLLPISHGILPISLSVLGYPNLELVKSNEPSY